MGGLIYHTGGGFYLDVSPRNRKLNPLVLSDGSVKDHAIFSVGGRAIDKEAAVADAFTGNQNAFRVHAIEYVLKALALRTNQIFDGHTEFIKEQFGRAMIQHGPNRTNSEPVPHCVTHINQQHADAL